MDSRKSLLWRFISSEDVEIPNMESEASAKIIIDNLNICFCFRVMSVMISIGIATTASGLVIYVLLSESIGLPIEDAFLVLPFDAFLCVA